MPLDFFPQQILWLLTRLLTLRHFVDQQPIALGAPAPQAFSQLLAVRSLVRFVDDLFAQKCLKDIFQGHKAFQTAVFINHRGDLHTPGQHFVKYLINGRGFRHHQ